MQYQLVAKGDGERVVNLLREYTPALHGVGWALVGSPQPLSYGESKIVINFEGVDRETVEIVLNGMIVNGVRQPPYPDGTLLHWTRL
jgi:hypothetical protein